MPLLFHKDFNRTEEPLREYSPQNSFRTALKELFSRESVEIQPPRPFLNYFGDYFWEHCKGMQGSCCKVGASAVEVFLGIFSRDCQYQSLLGIPGDH